MRDTHVVTVLLTKAPGGVMAHGVHEDDTVFRFVYVTLDHALKTLAQVKKDIRNEERNAGRNREVQFIYNIPRELLP